MVVNPCFCCLFCIQLWSRSDLRHLGTFKGHKRGVWAAQFSPTDKILATASNDLTIMLWDITSFSCLKVALHLLFKSKFLVSEKLYLKEKCTF